MRLQTITWCKKLKVKVKVIFSFHACTKKTFSTEKTGNLRSWVAKFASVGKTVSTAWLLTRLRPPHHCSVVNSYSAFNSFVQKCTCTLNVLLVLQHGVSCWIFTCRTTGLRTGHGYRVGILASQSFRVTALLHAIGFLYFLFAWMCFPLPVSSTSSQCLSGHWRHSSSSVSTSSNLSCRYSPSSRASSF